MKIHQTFSGQLKPVPKLVDYLHSGRGEEMLDVIRLPRLLCKDGEKKRELTNLASYVENDFDDSYGSISLRDRAGAKEGANNLLKLKISYYDKTIWEEFQERQNLSWVSSSTNQRIQHYLS